MKTSLLLVVSAIAAATALTGCSAASSDTETESTDDALGGVSPTTVLRANAATAIKAGTMDGSGKACGYRVPLVTGHSGTPNTPLFQHHFGSTNPSDYVDGIEPSEMRSDFWNRKLTYEYRYGNTFPFPCQLSNNCQVLKVEVEYNTQNKITRITQTTNGQIGKYDGVCTITNP